MGGIVPKMMFYFRKISSRQFFKPALQFYVTVLLREVGTKQVVAGQAINLDSYTQPTRLARSCILNHYTRIYSCFHWALTGTRIEISKQPLKGCSGFRAGALHASRKAMQSWQEQSYWDLALPLSRSFGGCYRIVRVCRRLMVILEDCMRCLLDVTVFCWLSWHFRLL